MGSAAAGKRPSPIRQNPWFALTPLGLMTKPVSLDSPLQCLAASDWDGYVDHLRQEFEDREPLWKELGSQHGKGIDLVERLLAWPEEKGAGRVLSYLVPALGYAELTAPEVLQLFGFASSLGAAAPYRIVAAIRPTFKGSPAIAREVGDAVRKDPSLTAMLGFWSSAFAQVAPRDAASYAKDLPTATREQRGVLAEILENLDTSLADVSAVLSPDADRLLAAALEDAPNTGGATKHWSAVRALAQFHAPAMETLMQAAQSGQAPALVVVAMWLSTHNALTIGAIAVPVGEVIDLLLERAISNDELRAVVDSNLQWLFYNPTVGPIAMDCIGRLAGAKAPVGTMFGEVFGAIKQKEPKFSQLLTAWLLSPEASIQAVRSLLVQCAAGTAPVALDASQFMAAPEHRQVEACRRILNLTIDGPALCKFIDFFAADPGMQPTGLGYANQMLPVVMEEFPGATEGFLRMRTRAAHRQEPYAALYRGVLAQALRWRRVLEQLPERGELKQSDDETNVLRLRRQRKAQEITRSANERSFFRDMATKIHLAQGKRFVTHHQRGPSDISGMAELSHSVELPSSDLSDPARASMNRTRNLKASR